MKNYVTEDELKKAFPELALYLWKGQENYNSIIEDASQTVISDFINKRYDLRRLQSKLYVTNEISKEDVANRLRLVVNVTAFEGTPTLTLKGTNDDETFIDILEKEFTEIGETSYLFTDAHSKYKIVNDGTIAFTAFLVETNIDLFFKFKSMEMIMQNQIDSEGDRYDLQMKIFNERYTDLWNTGIIYVDENEDGELVSDEAQNQSMITYSR